MGVLDSILDALVPVTCAGCGAAGRVWCRECAGLLAHPSVVRVPGVPLTYAAGRYEGAVRKAITAWKEESVGVLTQQLAPALAHAIALVIETQNLQGALLVPVPISLARARRRNGDALYDLVSQAAARLCEVGVGCTVDSGLTTRRGRHDQSGLDKHARQRNMFETMTVNELPDGPVVVVDDIVTTGATLREAVRALGDRTPAGCAALAATPRHVRLLGDPS